MKNMLLVLVALFSISALADDVYVQGHYRQDGTYVEGYHRTSNDDTVNNNYGTVGNSNPYSGYDGTRQRNDNQGSGNYNYGNGQSSGQYRSHHRR